MPSSAGSALAASAAKCSHAAIVHGNGNGKHSARHPCFLAINTPLGNLKMWMNTTFRGFKTGHHAVRYRAEFQYRFNRRFDLGQPMPALLQSCALQRPATELALPLR